MTWNQKVLFFGIHDSHYDTNYFGFMLSNFIQKLILKAGDSENYQPKDNGANTDLKLLYNRENNKWR